jgi:general secretion pathway protein H
MRGFTLLEMLVVLVVASIMLTVVTLNLMPSAQTVLREESQRLAFLMENGAMASQAGGQPLAWSGTAYTSAAHQRGEWVRIERDNLLHAHLPEAVHMAKSLTDAASKPGTGRAQS